MWNKNNKIFRRLFYEIFMSCNSILSYATCNDFSSLIYMNLSILFLDKVVEPYFDETGVIVMVFVISFIIIGLLINCLVSIGVLKLIYNFFDKDVYDFVPFYSLFIGLVALFMTLFKLFIDYYKNILTCQRKRMNF